MNLQDLMQGAEVWRGNGFLPPAGGATASGFAALDALLPGGGWPAAALTEILLPRAGIGELSLMMPALAALSRGDRWLAFVAPPYIPYAPALAAAGVDLSRVLMIHPRSRGDALWALEQTLRAGTCGAVLAWPALADTTVLRRLQRAAEIGDCLGVVFRSALHAVAASPAALRLRLVPEETGLGVEILKRRGGWPAGPVRLEMDRAVAVSAPAGSGARRLHARRP
jgi:hypothetical protein